MKKKEGIFAVMMVSALLISVAVFSQEKSIFINSYFLYANEKPSSQMFLPLSFSILGDIHDDVGKLENAIKDFSNFTSKEDLLVLNGDIVDEGLDMQYNSVQNCLEKNNSYLPQIVVKNIGNHEYYQYSKGVNSSFDIEKFVSRFLLFSGEKSIYHDTLIKGYHFIFLGSEQCYTPELGTVQAFLSEEQLKWLSVKLSESSEPNRPIFVFLHQPLNGNFTSFSDNIPTVKQNIELYNILSKYQQVILFTSHTHMFLNANNMIYIKQPFVAVQTGAIHHPIKQDEDDDKNPMDNKTSMHNKNFENESQGLYIEIKNNQIIIRGRDIKNKSWMNGVVFKKDL